jgi:hypothetical protein
MAWELILNFPNSTSNTESRENNHIAATEIGNIFLNTKKVMCKVILSFTLYPLFQSYRQSKENLLNLSMKC